ncbi:hypothetical protein JCM11251_004366 [Rhodosporidiobolus azoricus]
MDHSSMSGMDMGGSSSSGTQACQMSTMLWDWNWKDACFISEQWHVRSVGDYVGTIIGVFFITLSIEAVRRLGRDYDKSIKTAYYKRESRALAALAKNMDVEKEDVGEPAPFRPSTKEHLIRSAFYGVQFSAAYILMLLAMSFNGGVVLAIFAGGFVGYALFARDTAEAFELPKDDPVQQARPSATLRSAVRSSSMAQQRLGQVAAHFSSSARSSNAPVSPDTNQPPVLVESVNALRKITLNRPKALNALNDAMVDLIQPALLKFEASELANVILIKGNGKHFCAGGDVVALTKNLDNEANWHKASDFFTKEYNTNHILATTHKPVVSIMHGVTFGGGVGMTGHGAFRVATESTQIAMPETKIGLFPDVGANFILPRLDGQLGLYLALTSFPLKGAATYLAGLATHYVPSERLPALETRLAELDVSASFASVNAALDEFAADADEVRTALKNYPLVGSLRRAIDSIFARHTAEEIVTDLQKLEDGSLDLAKIVGPAEGAEFDTASLQKWAKETREAILLRSPTSVKLAIKAYREGAKMTLDEVLQTDARIAAACCSVNVHPDFKTGVTDLLIKKIKPEEQRPAWQPATLEEVRDKDLHTLFFSNKPPFSSPPVPRLDFKQTRRSRPRALAPFKESPHRKYLLPREVDVERIVKGEDAGSDEYAVTREEVVDRLVQRYNGKVGVKEKVEEILSRKTREGEQRTLTWH